MIISELFESVATNETIRKVGKEEYRLYSKSGKNLGTYPSRRGAENREKEVNYFSHTNDENLNEGPGDGDGDDDGFGFMESVNPTDSISMDIPLFIRLLEYAREDAKTDMDLHHLSEKAIELSKDGKTLTMDQYEALVGEQKLLPAESIAPVRPVAPVHNRLQPRPQQQKPQPRKDSNPGSFAGALKDAERSWKA